MYSYIYIYIFTYIHRQRVGNNMFLCFGELKHWSSCTVGQFTWAGHNLGTARWNRLPLAVAKTRAVVVHPSNMSACEVWRLGRTPMSWWLGFHQSFHLLVFPAVGETQDRVNCVVRQAGESLSLRSLKLTFKEDSDASGLGQFWDDLNWFEDVSKSRLLRTDTLPWWTFWFFLRHFAFVRFQVFLGFESNIFSEFTGSKNGLFGVTW